MSRSVTERGFVSYDEFTDSYGSKVTVRESSAASEPKVWIFCDNPQLDEPSPHLTVGQAIRVRNALNDFIEERGSL